MGIKNRTDGSLLTSTCFLQDQGKYSFVKTGDKHCKVGFGLCQAKNLICQIFNQHWKRSQQGCRERMGVMKTAQVNISWAVES